MRRTVLLHVGWCGLSVFIATNFMFSVALGNDFNKPWRDKNRALVLDAYSQNHLEWEKLVSNKQISAFIAKASDGIAPKWGCADKPKDVARELCEKTWRNYSLKKELFHSRRTLAKQAGWLWGAYHLGRAGRPVEQANHFLNFAKPEKNDLIALDIEHIGEEWISLEDAEIFSKHIHTRIGRYPLLYTNHKTAKHIAANKEQYPLLSRMPLWYARYKPAIPGVFPMGNWDSYTLWQFSSGSNCKKKRCPIRIKGALRDIDVNVTYYSNAEIEKHWPFDGLLDVIEEPEEPTIASSQTEQSKKAI